MVNEMKDKVKKEYCKRAYKIVEMFLKLLTLGQYQW